ncbi:MAG: acyltransferase, partial [Sphingomonas sp.]|nr:acyltransferase [Sphingomonas sp.]
MRRLYGLDALRGIAAICVMVGHFAATFGLGEYPFHAGLAVDLFFILSGFVMTRTYEERLRSGLTAPQFIALRYRRLFLPLAIGSTLGLIGAAAVIGPAPQLLASWVFILAFLPTVWLGNAFLLNGPAWSLFLEILSNALHGTLLAKTSTRRLAALYAASVAVFIATYFAGLSHWDYGLSAILWLIPRELSAYLIGIIIFRVYGDRPLGNRPAIAIAAFMACLWAATLNPFVELACALVFAP